MKSDRSPAASKQRSTRIADLHRIRPAFLRSVNIALDHADPSSSQAYVTTDFGREAFNRILAGLQPASSERAWRITGDYGSGKSAFGLCLARIAAQEREKLPAALHNFVGKDTRLEPVLVTGSPESLEKSIRKGLAELRRRVFDKPVRALENASNGNTDILALIDEHITALQGQKIAQGLFLILDELGQNLQHAVLHPSAGDISLIQSLGEKADRSRNRPLMVVALLHQGLGAYSTSAGLDPTTRREWDKVSGRYRELIFAQPVEQVAGLVTEMLGLEAKHLSSSVKTEVDRGMRRAITEGFYGAAPAEQYLHGIAPRLYPLHPTVLPVLLRLLRRFGQNERSLVGFLSSHEPFGFRDFSLTNPQDGRFYRIQDLYDYFRVNLAPGLSGSDASQWEIIQSTVVYATKLGEPSIAILKTVGLLNLLDDRSLIATDVLLASAVGNQHNLFAAIKDLRTKSGLLHERGSSKGLSLWPHTSVNMEKAGDEADRALASEPLTARAVIASLTPRAVVARGHYIETGNLRHFAVTYLDLVGLRELLAKPVSYPTEADGQVWVVLPETEREQTAATSLLTEKRAHLHALALVGVSMPVSGALSIAHERRRWDWIHSHVRELAGDAFARAHVVTQIRRAEHRLERALRHVVQLRDGAELHEKIAWFDAKGSLKASPTRGILPQLSVCCDSVFDQCPKVPNELVNRRITSAAASKARSLLIEAMAKASDREDLGFDPTKSPPEYSIYLSVLLAGNVHVKSGKSWRMRGFEELKDDPRQLAPSLRKIHEILVSADTKRCAVPAIFAALRVAPYGVRDGLMPLLLAIYLAGEWDQTAIYEDGTFIEKPGADLFMRLGKEPEAFDLQHCSVKGVRRELFNRVASILNLPSTHRPDVLQVIRPLIVFAARLPEYSKHTSRHVDASSREMRDALLDAREPATLLFSALPQVFGFAPFVTDGSKRDESRAASFADALNRGMIELRDSYPRLLDRLGESLLKAFRFQGSIAEFRAEFAVRRRAVEPSLTEKELDAFSNRLADPAYGEREWLESIGSFLAHKAPERWRDADEDEFHLRVASLTGRFTRVESHGFNGKVVDPEKFPRSICFTLTRPNGTERQEVVHWAKSQDKSVEEARAELKKLLVRYGSAALPAAAEIVWEHLTSRSSK